jgi:hypothetical protein
MVRRNSYRLSIATTKTDDPLIQEPADIFRTYVETHAKKEGSKRSPYTELKIAVLTQQLLKSPA